LIATASGFRLLGDDLGFRLLGDDLGFRLLDDDLGLRLEAQGPLLERRRGGSR